MGVDRGVEGGDRGAAVVERLYEDTLQDQDWERAWLDQFHPMQFGRRLWVCPDGQRPADDKDAVLIDLDPGLAFGTGTHPTTALCLRWLDRQDLRGRTLIDFGCGSGILAIAALKLGARHAIAVDHDPQAVLAARDNGERNGVSDRLSVVRSSDFLVRPVDVVVANILANVLIALADDISALLKPDADLVMSGILTTQADDVIAAYVDLCDFEPCQTSDDWVLLHGRRR